MAGITLREIADRLGVSETAISFAINNQPGISDETRSRILEEIEKANYKPRKTKGVKGRIALVLSMHKTTESDNPILSAILNSVYKEAEKAKYQIDVIYSVKGSKIPEADLNKHDGLLVLGTVMQEDDIMPLVKIGKPLVVMDNGFIDMPINTVSIDNVGGIASAVKYLYENGHSQIGYIKSVFHMRNFIERYTEFERSASKLGLETRDIISVGMSPAGAYEEMCQWFKSNKLSATALVADNDYIALGAIRALREQGITPGQDISIIGFDDLQYSHVSDPPLTTVRIYGDKIGAVSFNRLLEVIQDPEQPYSHIMMGTKLIIRDSVVKI